MSKLWPAPSGWYVILSRSVFQRRYIIMSPQKSCLFVVNTFIMRIKASYKHVIEHWWKKASFVSDQDDKSSTWSQLSLPVLLFWPNCWLGHPENLSVMLSKIIFSGSKYSKNILFNFEKGSTGPYKLRANVDTFSSYVAYWWICRSRPIVANWCRKQKLWHNTPTRPQRAPKSLENRSNALKCPPTPPKKTIHRDVGLPYAHAHAIFSSLCNVRLQVLQAMPNCFANYRTQHTWNASWLFHSTSVCSDPTGAQGS